MFFYSVCLMHSVVNGVAQAFRYTRFNEKFVWGIHACRASQTAGSQKSARDPKISGQSAISFGGHSVVSATGAARELFPLFRRRLVRGSGSARERIPASDH